MIGTKDVAFPRLNLMSFYLYVGGGIFLCMALLFGGVDTGWTFYTPLSSSYANGNVMAAALGVFIIGFSSILTGLNFIVTIHRMRAPGMTWFRMPLSCGPCTPPAWCKFWARRLLPSPSLCSVSSAS